MTAGPHVNAQTQRMLRSDWAQHSHGASRRCSIIWNCARCFWNEFPPKKILRDNSFENNLTREITARALGHVTRPQSTGAVEYFAKLSKQQRLPLGSQLR